jgi:hypothetical protein
VYKLTTDFVDAVVQKRSLKIFPRINLVDFGWMTTFTQQLAKEEKPATATLLRHLSISFPRKP